MSPSHLCGCDIVTRRVLSPYQLNPPPFNPLRDLLEQTIDVERIRACETVKLFISATNVETGKIRVFDHNGAHGRRDPCLGLPAVTIFHAVEVDGRHYWDGGYGQSSALPADLQLPVAGHRHHPHQPDRAQGRAADRA